MEKEENNKIIYSPEFIPYYLDDVKKMWLSLLEWLCYWFIRFYCKKHKFFFSSDEFSKVIQTSTWTIDNIISKLVKIWIIKTKTKRYNNCWKFKSIREIEFNSNFLNSLNDENVISSDDENVISSGNEIKDNNKDNNKDNITNVIEQSSSFEKNLEENNSLEKVKLVLENWYGVIGWYKGNSENLIQNPPPKKIYWNPEINELLEIIKSFNNWIIDWTIKEQRQYWDNLLKKIKQIDKIKNLEYIRQDYIKAIFEIISKNSYHSHKITWPKKVFYELAWLIAICNQEYLKQTQKEEKKVKIQTF